MRDKIFTFTNLMWQIFLFYINETMKALTCQNFQTDIQIRKLLAYWNSKKKLRIRKFRILNNKLTSQKNSIRMLTCKMIPPTNYSKTARMVPQIFRRLPFNVRTLVHLNEPAMTF